jgi:hypothetical protein
VPTHGGSVQLGDPGIERQSLPFTTFLLLAFGMGLGVALAGAHELRLSPRHALLTASFGAFISFLLLLVLPASIYFYVFHGDWFMLYLVDVARVPSALALIGFVLEALIGVLGFSLGANLVRNQRTSWAMGTLAVTLGTALALLFVFRDRLRLVGTYNQFRGGFGLVGYGGPLLQGALTMGVVLLAGAAFLVFRVRSSPSR